MRFQRGSAGKKISRMLAIFAMVGVLVVFVAHNTTPGTQGRIDAFFANGRSLVSALILKLLPAKQSKSLASGTASGQVKGVADERTGSVLGESLGNEQLVFRIGTRFRDLITAQDIEAAKIIVASLSAQRIETDEFSAQTLISNQLLTQLATVEQDLTVGGNTILTGAITVGGEGTLTGPVTLGSTLTLGGDVTGEGVTIDVGDGEVLASNLVYSLQGEVGELELVAGDGITIDGLTISNDDAGSDQLIFQKIAISGQGTVEADANTDTLTLVAGAGLSLTTDTGSDSITLSASSGDLNISGWEDLGTAVALQTISDNVGIGTTSPTYKLHVVGNTLIDGDLSVTGNTTVLSGFNNSGGGITNAGAITGATGLTSSGTITFSGLSTGVVQSSFAGALSSSALNLAGGASYITGALPTTNGGTAITTYTTGDILYASGANTLAKLGIGSDGETLVVSGGVPDWGTPGAGSPCATCLVTNPGSTQTITPTAATAVGLSIRQAAGGSVDIFNVTSNDGVTKYLRVDSSGNVQLGSNGTTTTGNFTVSPTGTDPLAIAPVAMGSDAFTGTITSADLTATRTWTLPDATGTFCLSTGNCAGSSAGVGGSGTTNYITKWSSTYGVTDSIMYDDGTNVGIGTTVPTTKLHVVGTGTITGATSIGGALTASSTLHVVGATDIDSTLNVDGDADLNATLGVTGATTLSSTLDVTGLTTLGGNLNVNGVGNSYFTGNLGIGTISPSQALDLIGSLELATTTTSTTGVIYKGSTAFIHDFHHPTGGTAVPDGYNFIAGAAGNFTMGSTAASVTEASYNNLIGYQAGLSNTTGYRNNFFGQEAGLSNTSGNNNNFLGYRAGRNNTTGASNNFLGWAAGYSNSGSHNNFLGYQAGTLNGAGSYNIFVGYEAGVNNTTASNNTFLGNHAGYYSQTGAGNMALGYQTFGQGTGATFTGADYNTTIGYQAGYSLGQDDDSNVFIGYQAGYSETGSNKLYLASGNNTALIYGDFATGAVGLGSTAAHTNPYLYIGETGNLGIGTTSPLGKLNIAGRATGKALAILNETGDQAIFAASASGTNRFVILNGGNVGIGRKDPQALLEVSTSDNSRFNRLSGGSETIRNSNNALSIVSTLENLQTSAMAADYGVSTVYNFARTGDATARKAGGIDVAMEQEWTSTASTNDSYMRFFTTGDSTSSEKLRITSAGNLGIGTTSPASLLEVSTTAGSNPTFSLSDGDVDHGMTALLPTNQLFKLQDWSVSAGGAWLTGASDLGSVPGMTLHGVIGSSDPTDSIAAISLNGSKSNGTTSYQEMGSAETVLEVETGTVGSGTKLLTILGSGNVGIGTTVPTGKLHVGGAATGKALAIFNETGNQNILTASASGTTVLNLDRSGNLAVEGQLSDLGGTTLTVNDDFRVLGAISVTGSSSFDGAMQFGNGTNDTLTFTGRVGSDIVPSADNTYDLGTSALGFAEIYTTSLFTDGNVGIGTTTAGARLDVETDSASSYAGSFFNDGNAATRWGVLIQAGLDDQTAAGPSTLMQFNDGDGGSIGSITFGSSLTAYNTTSDQRAKQNIASTTMGIEQLMNIKIRDFSFIADANNKIHTGFIAQELYEVFPDAVTPFTDGRYWQVDYGKVTPLIIKSVQDQQAQITSLQQQQIALNSEGLLTSEDQAQVLGAVDELTENIGGISLLVQTLQNGFDVVLTDIAWLKTAVTNLQQLFTFSSNTVTVTKDVMFSGREESGDSDRAGWVVVPAGQSSAEVKFDKPYKQRPVITATPEGATEGYYLEAVSELGFKITLKQPLGSDVTFNWSAILVKDARTTKDGTTSGGSSGGSSSGGASGGGSEGSPAPSGGPAASPTPSSSPQPSSVPSASPEPSPSTTPEPAPSPVVSPQPSASPTP